MGLSAASERCEPDEGREAVVADGDALVPGLDLAYERTDADDLVTAYPIDSENGSAKHFMPNLVPAFAVSDGVISYAGKQPHGYAIIIDHRNGWASYYANLEHMFATVTNIASYLPFLTLPGDTGKFIYSLPIVLSLSLVASRLPPPTPS